MKNIIVRRPYCSNGKAFIEHIKLGDIKVEVPCLIAIDGSTSNSGVSIVTKNGAALMYSMSFERDKENETPVRYKIELKRYIQNMLENYSSITEVYYEEPFCGHASAAPNLFMLRTFIEEIIIENEPRFNYIKHIEVNNMKWKAKYLAPMKVPEGTDNQKIAIRNKLITALPILSELTQDECDAYGLGLVCASAGESVNYTEDDLKTVKKTRPFKYEIQFIGGNDDDDVLEQVINSKFNIPDEVLSNGIRMQEINSRGNFEKHIYSIMGNDDKLIVIKFKSSSHANVILQYRLGVISTECDYLYAVVWRKNRKRG